VSSALRACLPLLALALFPAQVPAQDGAEVWLVGPSVRPSVVRYLRSQLDELDVAVRYARRLADARGPLVVRVAHRSARITRREGSELVELRTVTLPRGLDTAGRARLAHALRTVIRAQTDEL